MQSFTFPETGNLVELVQRRSSELELKWVPIHWMRLRCSITSASLWGYEGGLLKEKGISLRKMSDFFNLRGASIESRLESTYLDCNNRDRKNIYYPRIPPWKVNYCSIRMVLVEWKQSSSNCMSSSLAVRAGSVSSGGRERKNSWCLQSDSSQRWCSHSCRLASVHFN